MKKPSYGLSRTVIRFSHLTQLAPDQPRARPRRGSSALECPSPMQRVLSKIFGTANDRTIKRILPIVERIASLEPEVSGLSDAALRAKTGEFRGRLEKGEPEISLPEEVEPDVEPPREEPLIEKMEEIGASERGKRSGINIPRIATIAFGIIIIVFIGWWILTERSIRDKESSSQMTELVQKQRDAREAVDRSATEPAVTDSIAEEEEAPGEAGAGGQVQLESIEDAKDVVERQAEDQGESAAPPPESKPAVSGDRYGIHVHSFQTVERASTGARDLEKRGYEVEVIESVVKSRTIFRVYVVGFETRDEAIRASAELRALYGYAQVKKLNKQ